MSGPFFSVIIPVHNRAGMVREALDSVWRQTFTDYELIVVDDGSTDSSVEAVESEFTLFRKQFSGEDKIPEFKVIRQTNAGPGAARNTGIAGAAGRYTCFLDSDDLWFPWTLEVYRKAIAAANGVSFVAGRAAGGGGTDETEVHASPAPVFRIYGNYLESADDGVWIGTCAAALQTDRLRQVGGFVAARQNAEDSDLWLRFGVMPGFVRIEEPPVFRHRQTPGSEVSSPVQALAGMRCLLQRELHRDYPGGAEYRRNRRAIISRHLRPGLVQAAKAGYWRDALALYVRSFPLNASMLELKFLCGFPLLLLRAAATPRRR